MNEIIWYEETLGISKLQDPELLEFMRNQESYVKWICSASGMCVGIINGKNFKKEPQNSEDLSGQRQETPESK